MARLAQMLTTRRGHLACLGVLWAALVLSQCTPWFEMYPDTDVYLGLARSLAEGRGYTVVGRFNPMYPPGFPALLWLVRSSSRAHYVPEHLVVAAAGLGIVLGSYALLAQRYGGRRLLILSLLVALSPMVVRWSAVLMSDAPFSCLIIAFVAAATRYWRAPKLRWPLALGAMLALAAATLTRTAGVAFYAACVAWLLRPRLWRQDWRRCAVFGVLLLLVACPPVLAWRAWVRSQAGPRTVAYAAATRLFVAKGKPVFSQEALGRMSGRVWRSVRDQLGEGAEALFRVKWLPGHVYVGWALMALVALGLVRRVRGAELMDYAFWFYGVMILLWPFEHSRFWLPVLPLLWGYVAEGVDGLGRLTAAYPRLAKRRWAIRLDRAAARLREMLRVPGPPLLLALSAATSVGMVAARWQQGSQAVGNAVLKPSRRDIAVFLSREHPRPVVLASVRSVELIPAIHDPRIQVVRPPTPPRGHALAIQALYERGITHLAFERSLVAGRRSTRRQVPAEQLVEDHADRFRLVHETDQVFIYEVLPPPGGGSAPPLGPSGAGP